METDFLGGEEPRMDRKKQPIDTGYVGWDFNHEGTKRRFEISDLRFGSLDRSVKGPKLLASFATPLAVATGC